VTETPVEPTDTIKPESGVEFVVELEENQGKLMADVIGWVSCMVLTSYG
jgi:hypothetical protein